MQISPVAATVGPQGRISVDQSTSTYVEQEESSVPKTEPAKGPLVYKPHRISGGADHPGVIVETPGLANVSPPPVTYRPHLPRDLSEKGLLSAIQLERIIYAGQSHEQRLPNGARAGISIGDGTGTGISGGT